MKTLTEIRKMATDLNNKCSHHGGAYGTDLVDLLTITSAILDRLEQVENSASDAQQSVNMLAGSMAERGFQP